MLTADAAFGPRFARRGALWTEQLVGTGSESIFAASVAICQHPAFSGKLLLSGTTTASFGGQATPADTSSGYVTVVSTGESGLYTAPSELE